MIHHDFEIATTLVPLLENAAEKTPDAIAVQDGRRALSFTELCQDIDALSTRLQSYIAPGEHVAVQLPRGLEYIVAAFAIWKANGVYVPLDDNWPKARIHTILSSSHIRLLIQLNSDGMQLTILPGDSSEKIVVAGDPAYLIHTSGTTGTPKGVLVGHASLLHLVECHQRHIYEPQDVTTGAVALNASFCFDSSIERMALVALGYTVHVIEDHVRKSPHVLIQYLRDYGIVNVDFVPSHLSVLMKNGIATTVKDLKVVIVGGEAIDPALWQKLSTSHIVFFNVYGPTENTINTTFCRIQGTVPNIGRSFEGVGCHIVDSQGRCCPIGKEGELWVSGKHLALCYYNAPKATDKAFVEFDGVRCYRTGDLVKLGASDLLYFVGRLDEQVKINGHRIELADIHHHLSSLPGVNQAAVTPIIHENGVRLLGTIIWEPGYESETFSKLAESLAERVPHYMVPDNWQSLDKLLLTDNLKLDHKALQRSWEQTQLVATKADDEAKTWRESEREILEAWKRVITHGGLTLDDHFFTSGGDSLASMNLLGELEQLVSGEVELTVVFKYPTIRKMAEWLDETRAYSETDRARVQL